MSSDRDDDPLSWAGDEDPTLQTGRSHDDGRTKRQSRQERRKATADTAIQEPGTPAQTGPVMLVTLGIFGGVFLLYTIGWLLSGMRDSYSVISPIDQVMYSVGLWLAVAAAPLWFAVTLWFTRGRTTMRITWLVIGLVLLVPWPFVIGGL